LLPPPVDVQEKLLRFLVDLALPLAVGWQLRRFAGVRRETMNRLLAAGILLVTPLLTILALWQAPLEEQLLLLPLLGMLMQVLPGIVGLVRGRKRYQDPLERGSFILTCMFSNRSVIGILSVYIFFGQTGYAYTRLTLLLGAPTFYLIGFTMARYYQEKSRAGGGGRITLRSILVNRNQLPLLGILVGLAANLAALPRPASLVDPLFPWLVHLQAWLFLLPLGQAMELKKMGRYVRDGLEISLVRFLFTPLLVCPLAWLAGCRGILFGTVLVLSLTPASIGAVVAARLHGLNEHLPLTAYLVSSLLYLLVIFPALILVVGSGIF